MPRRVNGDEGRKREFGALSIEPLEVSRWRGALFGQCVEAVSSAACENECDHPRGICGLSIVSAQTLGATQAITRDVTV